MLKPLDFVRVRAQASGFITRLLALLFASAHSASPVAETPTVNARDPKKVASVIKRARRVPALHQGLIAFLRKSFTEDGNSPESQFVHWAASAAVDSLSRDDNSGESGSDREPDDD